MASQLMAVSGPLPAQKPPLLEVSVLLPRPPIVLLNVVRAGPIPKSIAQAMLLLSPLLPDAIG